MHYDTNVTRTLVTETTLEKSKLINCNVMGALRKYLSLCIYFEYPSLLIVAHVAARMVIVERNLISTDLA